MTQEKRNRESHIYRRKNYSDIGNIGLEQNTGTAKYIHNGKNTTFHSISKALLNFPQQELLWYQQHRTRAVHCTANICTGKYTTFHCVLTFKVLQMQFGIQTVPITVEIHCKPIPCNENLKTLHPRSHKENYIYWRNNYSDIGNIALEQDTANIYK